MKKMKTVVCPVCEGDGVNGKFFCPVCNGSGGLALGNDNGKERGRGKIPASPLFTVKHGQL